MMNKFLNIFSKKTDLPVISMPELFSDDGCVKILEPLVASGNITLLELFVINKLICCYQPKAVFEIGTFDGRTALNIAANALDEAKIYTLDLPSGKLNSTHLPIVRGDREFINKKESGLRYHGRLQEEKIVQLYGDSADFDFSLYEDKMDFVFVDGSHAYDYVMNDSMIALKLLKKGKGVILWHDYTGWVGVRKALFKLYERGGVFKNIKHIKGTSLVCLIIK